LFGFGGARLAGARAPACSHAHGMSTYRTLLWTHDLIVF